MKRSIKKHLLSYLLLITMIHKDLHSVTTAAQGQTTVVLALAQDTTPPLAYTFTTLYDKVALGGTPATFENSISYLTGAALATAYQKANNESIAGNDTDNYLTAFAKNIATASASAQTGPDNATSICRVYPVVPAKAASAADAAFAAYANADAAYAYAAKAAKAYAYAFASAAAYAYAASAFASAFAYADANAAYANAAASLNATYTSPAMFTAAYAAAYAMQSGNSYTDQATKYANAGKSPGSTNQASFASSFAKQASKVLTAVANYTGAAPTDFKQAAYAAAYAELYIAQVTQNFGTNFPLTSYSDVNAAIAAGITESASSKAPDPLVATTDAVSSASVIMAGNLGYNYVDVSEIDLYALQALAYSNPEQYLANLELMGVTPATLAGDKANNTISVFNGFGVDTTSSFGNCSCMPTTGFTADTVSNFISLFSSLKLIQNTYAWFLKQTLVYVQNILTINGTFKIEYSSSVHGSAIKIDVAKLEDVFVSTGGSVTLTTPMPIVLTVNGVVKPISSVKGLTVKNSGTEGFLGVTGALYINARASGNYISIGDGYTVTISDVFICDGKNMGSIDNSGSISVVKDIDMSNNYSQAPVDENRSKLRSPFSTPNPISNGGTISSTAGAITMNNNQTGAIMTDGVRNAGTISAFKDVTMNSNSGGGQGSGVIAGTLKTNGSVNLSVLSDLAKGQTFYGDQIITKLDGTTALLFASFKITVNTTLFAGTYAELNAAYPGMVSLQTQNQV